MSVVTAKWNGWFTCVYLLFSFQRLNFPHRVASLMRFREKRKERNFDKKIRYTVRKEVALRLVIAVKLWLGILFLLSEVPLILFCRNSINLIVILETKYLSFFMTSYSP